MAKNLKVIINIILSKVYNTTYTRKSDQLSYEFFLTPKETSARSPKT